MPKNKRTSALKFKADVFFVISISDGWQNKASSSVASLRGGFISLRSTGSVSPRQHQCQRQDEHSGGGQHI